MVDTIVGRRKVVGVCRSVEEEEGREGEKGG